MAAAASLILLASIAAASSNVTRDWVLGGKRRTSPFRRISKCRGRVSPGRSPSSRGKMRQSRVLLSISAFERGQSAYLSHVASFHHSGLARASVASG